MAETPPVQVRTVDIIFSGPGSWPGLRSIVRYAEGIDRQLGTMTEVRVHRSAIEYLTALTRDIESGQSRRVRRRLRGFRLS